MREVETLIIGGGISGLACADTLTRNRYRDFVLVSPDVGGRIYTSNNGRVNYGAYYVRRDYHHMLPHVTRKRRLRAWRVRYLDDDKLRPIYASMLRHPVAMARLLRHIQLFDRHYQRFKRNACMTPRRAVIEADPLLYDLYRTDAINYLRNANLVDLQDGLINPIVWGTALVDIREISACSMLFLLLILIHPTWEFDFDPSRLISTFVDRWIQQEVGSIQRFQRQWEVETRDGQQYLAANIVVALPIETSSKRLRLEWQVNKPLISWMVHVNGTPKPCFAKDRYIVLAPYGKDVIIARQADDS